MISGKELSDRGLALLRGTWKKVEPAGRKAAGDVTTRVKQAQARRREAAPKEGMDDVTLARKVETELFRPADAPKGSVDVNVYEGVVELRGEVKRPEQITELVSKAEAIPEVRSVTNLLHLPKTPSPTRADTPASQQKQTSKATPKPSAGRVTDDQTDKIVEGEPTPAELAEEGKGRQPAPLGSQDQPAGDGGPGATGAS
jgi:hypothetical protein